jgi:hypothetical protein
MARHPLAHCRRRERIEPPNNLAAVHGPYGGPLLALPGTGITGASTGGSG